MLARSRVLSNAPALLRSFKTIPQPPGNIVGTVNDAYVPPAPHKAEGSLHWTAERLVATSMVPLTVGAFANGGLGPAADLVLGAALLFHCFVGFQLCIIDYIPKRVYGAYHGYAVGLLTAGTVLGSYGLYELEKDGGLSGVAKGVWEA